MGRSLQEGKCQRISKPPIPSPQPRPSQPIPIPSPFHSVSLFRPAHASHCSLQTFWHLTEFHLEAENECWERPGSHRGKPPPQARILIQDHHGRPNRASGRSQGMSLLSTARSQAPRGRAGDSTLLQHPEAWEARRG